MDKNKLLSIRLSVFSKYSAITALIAFIIFLIINAINTGNNILFIVSYTFFIVSIICLFQFICLFLISKYYDTKSK